MKRLFAFLLTFILMIPCMALGVGAETAEDTVTPESVKILAIGNSFSIDAMQWLYDILTDLGVKEVVLGNLYIGSCTLQTHAEKAASGEEAYTYYKCSAETNGEWITEEGKKSLSYGLTNEAWDYISLQEASGTSGIGSVYEPYLTDLIQYVNTHKTNPDAKLMWHMTWAYQGDSRHKSFPVYGRNQEVMYHAILEATKQKVLPHDEISFVIPAGTAIQNMRTSILGDTLTRDGYHLNYTVGRYTAGVMWAKSILGTDLSGLKTMPTEDPSVTPEQLEIVIESVENAYQNPFAVTYSKKVTPEQTTAFAEREPYTIVKADGISVYDEATDSICFQDGSLAYNGGHIVYLTDAAVDLGDSVCCYVDGSLYLPRLVTEYMSGEKTYEAYTGDIADCDIDIHTADGKTYGTLVITNYLKDTPIASGTVRFLDETIRAAVGEVAIPSINGRGTVRTQVELPLPATGGYSWDLSYAFTTEYGTYTYDDTRYFIFANATDGITVDGTIGSGEWDTATKLNFKEPSPAAGMETEWTGTEDLSAVAYLAYDDTTLYLAAEVTDDTFSSKTHKVWLDGDSIQFDIYHDRTGHFEPGSYPEVYTEIGISFFEGQPGIFRYKGQTADAPKAMLENADLSIGQTENKTTYELAITWKELFGYDFTPTADEALGFVFIVNENDGDLPLGWLKFASGAGGNDPRNPNLFAQLYFADAPEGSAGKSFVENTIPYVPFRRTFEASGADVSWDDPTETATAAKDDTVVSATIGDTKLYINGNAKSFDGEVKLLNGRTYIPRAVAVDLFQN